MVTAGLTESNGMQPTAGFMTNFICRLTARNRDQLRNPTLGNRVWDTVYLLSITTCCKIGKTVLKLGLRVRIKVGPGKQMSGGEQFGGGR